MDKDKEFEDWLIDHDIRFVYAGAEKYHILHPVEGVPLMTVEVKRERLIMKPPCDTQHHILGMYRIKRTIKEEYEKIFTQPTALRLAFLNHWRFTKNQHLQVVVVAVKLPTGAVEVITNYQDLDSKLQYYKEAYDSQFRLKNNPNVQIVGFMIV